MAAAWLHSGSVQARIGAPGLAIHTEPVGTDVLAPPWIPLQNCEIRWKVSSRGQLPHEDEYRPPCISHRSLQKVTIRGLRGFGIVVAKHRQRRVRGSWQPRSRRSPAVSSQDVEPST